MTEKKFSPIFFSLKNVSLFQVNAYIVKEKLPKELEVYRAPNPEPKKIVIKTPNENSGAQGSRVEPAEGAQSASYGPGAMPTMSPIF